MENESRIAQIFKSLNAGTLMELAAILLGAVLLIVAVQRLLPWIAGRLHGRKRLNLLAVTPLIRMLAIIVAVGLSVPLLIEPSMQNMVALLGTVGLALGFALKDYASSLIAGIVAIGEKPYRNGDWIEVGGIYGEVRHVGMRTVHLVTPDDSWVAIPHARLWTDAIINANNGAPRLQCVTDFYLHPHHDAKRVRQVLGDVALTSAYLYLNDPIAVIVTEKPWGTHYRLKAYPVDSAQQFQFVSDLTVRGKEALRRLGVEFAAVPAISQAP
jgi:small-conductance mechanosensitive channel